jgi:hypothetical protein
MIRRAPLLLACALLAGCATRQEQGRVPLPPAPPLSEPANFIGVTAAALKSSLGAPAIARKDGGIEMWRYPGSNCQAFFFLYPDHGTLKVQHVETLPRPASTATSPGCLRSLGASTRPVS